MTEREALKLALEALKSSDTLINGTETTFGLEGAMDGYYSDVFDVDGNNKLLDAAITALEEALALSESSTKCEETSHAQPEQELLAWKNAALRVGEDLSFVGPNGYYNMTAQQWLDWAMAQQPRGKNFLAQPEQGPVAWMHNHIEGNVIAHRPADIDRHPERWTALYPDQKPTPKTVIPNDWKLVPRKATPEMLKAMDECAQEGYDERLYEGMASSVYMAAWDASPVLGTLPPSEKKNSMMDMIVGNLVREGINKHRARELAEHFIKQCNYTNGYCTGRTDLLSEQKAQKPVATMWQHGETGRTRITMPDDITDCDARWFKVSDLYTTPPHRKPLTVDEVWQNDQLMSLNAQMGCSMDLLMEVVEAIEAAHGIKE